MKRPSVKKNSQDQRQYPTKKIKVASDPITNKPSTTSLDTASIGPYVYFNRISRQREKYTPSDIAALGINLLKWALEDPEADKLSYFFKSQLVAKTTLARLRKANPIFDEDCELASELIGCRLWSNSLRRKWDPGTCIKFLPIYDEEYREETVRLAKLRVEEQKAQQQPAVFNIHNHMMDEEKKANK